MHDWPELEIANNAQPPPHQNLCTQPPTEDMTPSVNALARITGSNPVPEWKASVGYVYVKDKFGNSGLSPQESDVGAAEDRRVSSADGG
jgi:hypothetical protein